MRAGAAPREESSLSRIRHNRRILREKTAVGKKVTQKATHSVGVWKPAGGRREPHALPWPFPPDAGKPISDSLGGATRSVPEAGDPVLIKHRISTHHWNGLNQALSHEEPVKRISVVERQSQLPFGELERDG